MTISTRFDLAPELIESMHQLYRELHASPELSMQEYDTAYRLEQLLDELGI